MSHRHTSPYTAWSPAAVVVIAIKKPLILIRELAAGVKASLQGRYVVESVLLF
jgi:hypothetical protein